MRMNASEYLSGVRDEMRLFLRKQCRPTVNELEGMMTRLSTGIALTEEQEAEARLPQTNNNRRPKLTVISNHDNNGGDAA